MSEHDWSKPAAIAIPKEGYFELERGRYGPIYPRTPACYGFSIIAKVKEGREEAVRAYGKQIEEAIAGSPDVLAPLRLHYLRWVLFDVGSGLHFQYQGIFDTDFDKYTEDAVALFSATGITTVFTNLEGAGHVFATGMSNGGFMTNRLACDHADVFAAIAPVSGTLGVGVACNPSRPVSVLDAHGTGDAMVPFNGGDGPRPRRGQPLHLGGQPGGPMAGSSTAARATPTLEALPRCPRRHRRAPFRLPALRGQHRGDLLQDRKGRTHLAGRQAYLPKAVIGSTTRAFDGSESSPSSS